MAYLCLDPVCQLWRAHLGAAEPDSGRTHPSHPRAWVLYPHAWVGLLVRPRRSQSDRSQISPGYRYATTRTDSWPKRPGSLVRVPAHARILRPCDVADVPSPPALEPRKRVPCGWLGWAEAPTVPVWILAKGSRTGTESWESHKEDVARRKGVPPVRVQTALSFSARTRKPRLWTSCTYALHVVHAGVRVVRLKSCPSRTSARSIRRTAMMPAPGSQPWCSSQAHSHVRPHRLTAM